ncbi:hypothetical protein QBC35DRAFT_97308 [Podospora australis]|uniref:Fucose-specific lectin n=1 Tax=Podospora australis TaxID=1536484 RepID=A0AAN7AEE1_9PEZI|nr:hypothetical protein QBC35DRAFT_97308 [Podospora australis]
MAEYLIEQLRLLHWLLFMLLPTLSRCGSMAAWWTDLGPSFILQNASTGLLTHSLCHSNNTPLYPVDPPRSLKLTYAPKKGTALAATGWYDPGNNLASASIFYQNNNDDIVNALFHCDHQTGEWSEQPETDVISDRPGMVAPNSVTGLSVALLGQSEGYRVFYHDKVRALHALKFKQEENWSYGGPISPNTNRSTLIVNSMFSGVRNVTVVSPRDDGNIEAVRLHSDEAWHIETLPTPLGGRNITNMINSTSLPYNTSSPPPFQLKAWDGKPKSIGIAIDSFLTRFVFYIGTDRSVHSLAAFTSGNVEGGFRPQADQRVESWPLADESNSDFAIASHIGTNNIRLYYISGGQLIETKYRDGNWDVATSLQAANTTVINNTGDKGAGSGDSSGLSTGAKAGIGVGVSVGALLIIGAAVAFWRSRKRKSAPVDEETETPPTAAATEPPMSPASPSQDGASTFQTDIARTGSGLSAEKWDHELKDTAVTPPPRELESPNLASELPNANDRSELPTKHHVTELP